MESRIKVGLNRGYKHAMCTYAQVPDMHEQCVDLKCKNTVVLNSCEVICYRVYLRIYKTNK